MIKNGYSKEDNNNLSKQCFYKSCIGKIYAHKNIIYVVELQYFIF